MWRCCWPMASTSFNPLQAKLLALLAAQARRTIITLTTVPDGTAGRRFNRAFERLQITFKEYETPLRVQNIEPGYTQERHPALNHLLGNIFRTDPPSQNSYGCLNLIEAPDPARESCAALRRVKTTAAFRLRAGRHCDRRARLGTTGGIWRKARAHTACRWRCIMANPWWITRPSSP